VGKIPDFSFLGYSMWVSEIFYLEKLPKMWLVLSSGFGRPRSEADEVRLKKANMSAFSC